jgi:large subunit ribosomal protein L21
MFAIVEASGRQYQLEAGRFVDVDLLEGSNGDSFVFDKVLMIVDGANSTTGAPFIEGAKVTGKILCNMKARKVIVYHQKPKKGTRKKQGHRQHYTRVLIDTIELKDQVLAKAEHKKAAAEKSESAKKETKAPAKAAAPKGEAKKAEAKPAKK